jgi:hypothetical protein
VCVCVCLIRNIQLHLPNSSVNIPREKEELVHLSDVQEGSCCNPSGQITSLETWRCDRVKGYWLEFCPSRLTAAGKRHRVVRYTDTDVSGKSVPFSIPRSRQ